jgi:phosphoglucosamine mutase
MLLCLKVGMAVGQQYPRLVIGRDTRTSGEAVRDAVTAGALAAGATVADAGILPTPTLALAAESLDAGIMITASHNPPEYNGIKLWNPDGSAFNLRQQQQIEDAVLGDGLTGARWQEMGHAVTYPDAVRRHIARIRREIPETINLKVALDCACGAGTMITPYLLREMGCDVVSLNGQPSGFFPRNPEPTPTSLETLIKLTLDSGADLGIAHDGDADRMMLVDGRGRFVSGDKLLAIFARDLGVKALVTTVDTSMVVEEMGFEVTRTPVGDSFVSEAVSHGLPFGGEACGAWVFPQISLCPDGIYAAARAVQIASRRPISELVDAIPEYPMVRGSVEIGDLDMASLEQRLTSLKPVSVSKVDGLRLNFEDGWLLIRPSGTEPKVRVTAEARTPEAMQQHYDDCLAIIRDAVGAV